MFTFIFSTLLSLSLHAQAQPPVGFASGNKFEASIIEGQVSVTCNGFNGTGFARYNCREIVLSPRSYDYFVGPREVGARQVTLKAYQEDGTTRSKSSGYQGSQGISRDSFNLWISTLFQRPLLGLGVNRIHYSIYSSVNNHYREYAQGEFTAEVSRGASRICPTTSYHSTDVNDCNSQYSVCQRYFEQYNYCR